MLSDFISRMSAFGGPDRTNLFMVEFFPTSNAVQYEGNLRFFCKSVEFPGVTFLTKQIRPQSYGHTYTMPYGFQPLEVGCIFILDSNNKIMKWFHDWTQKVINMDTTRGPHSQIGGQTVAELGYLRGVDGYGMNATITKFSPYDKNVRFVIEMRDVYPITVGNITLSWDENNTVAMLPVTLTYSERTLVGSDHGSTEGPFNRGMGEVRYLPSIGGSVQTINDFVQRVYRDEL